ncbi:MAG: DNA-binding transcriptional regulator PaaX [Candidatus Paceibacteria bacterium]|jgi:DNA-binding transcriptional regulator PaaX
MSKKKSIQEYILRALGARKSLKKRDLHSELFEEYTDDTKAKYALNRTLKALKDTDLVEQFDTEHSSFLRLTPEGQAKLRNIKLTNSNSLVSTSWDGFWRMILVDIPEDRKAERESFRYLLKKAGFLLLKNSVWISPYPLEHMFAEIKKDLSLGTEVMVSVSKLDPETEEELFKQFGME